MSGKLPSLNNHEQDLAATSKYHEHYPANHYEEAHNTPSHSLPPKPTNGVATPTPYYHPSNLTSTSHPAYTPYSSPNHKGGEI